MKPGRSRSTARQMLIVTVAIALATVARWLLDPALGNQLPYVTYFAAVFFIAFSSDLRPSLVALFLGWWAADFFFVPPRYVWFPYGVGTPYAVGTVMYFMVAGTGVAVCQALRATQRRVLAQSDRLRTMLDTALDSIITIDHEGKVIEFNPAAERTFGYRQQDVLGRELAELIIPEELRHAHRDGMRRYLETGEGPVLNRRVEMTALHANGEEFPVELAVTRLPTDDPPLFTAYLRDITDRVRAALSLSASEERFRSLVSVITDVPWVADAAGAFVSRQSAWEAYTGQTFEEHVGFGWTSAIHPDDRERVGRLWRHACDTGTLYEADGRMWHAPTQEWRHFKANAIPLHDETGAVREWVGTCTDIEEQRRAQGALEESNRHKDEFLAMLGHELRNPLAPICHALVMLRHDRQGSTADVALDTVQRQVDHLVRLVDDLLDASRISRGKIGLRREPVDLVAVIEQAVSVSEPRCAAAALRADVRLPDAPVVVDADAIRLTQVIGNLLGNACKYTPRGGEISVSLERSDDEAVIRVRDTGIGIEPEQFPSIFDMFEQGDRSIDDAEGGLGVGLPLSKLLVELHGGTIEGHSGGSGKGAEFIVRLPVVDRAPVPYPEAPRSPTALPGSVPDGSRRILVVDDNADAADSLAILLRACGHDIRIARDGEQALEAAGDYRPEVILLDIGLPRIDGYEVARRLRRQPWGKELTLIAMTGWGQEEDKRKSAAAGFDAHLVKPADFDQLLALIEAAGTTEPTVRGESHD